MPKMNKQQSGQCVPQTHFTGVCGVDNSKKEIVRCAVAFSSDIGCNESVCEDARKVNVEDHVACGWRSSISPTRS